MSDRILMSPPHVSELEEEYVLRALRSGWVAPTGPEVTAFEDEMAKRVDVAHAVALSSGTAALHLGLLGLGVKAGDAVIVPTMTFVASANAVVYTGAEPCFVDVRQEDGNLDVDLMREAIGLLRAQGRHVGAVMGVDLLGVCADNRAIEQVCADESVPFLEDAAEALGATDSHGSPAGSFGQAAALSFNGNKIMTTSGGGMLVSNDGDLADRARSLSTQAREPVLHYEHTQIGYNYRLSNVLAALGRAQLERLDSMITRRRSIRETYRWLLSDVPGTRVFGGDDDRRQNCWLTSVVVDPHVAGFGAADLAGHLNEAGIESRPLWKPMHLQPVFTETWRHVTGVAEGLFERGLTLPSGSVHNDDTIGRVVDSIQTFLRSRA